MRVATPALRKEFAFVAKRAFERSGSKVVSQSGFVARRAMRCALRMGCLGVLWMALTGCRCASSDDSAASGSPAEAGAAAARAVERCQRQPGRFTLQADRQELGSTLDDALPFAVELGSVVADEGGFTVPYLRPGDTTTRAALLHLNADLTQAQRVDLAPVHGDSPVPKLAPGKTGWAVALADSDASGGAYRLAWLPRSALGSAQQAEPQWVAEFDELADDSPAFDLAMADERVVLVWDEWDRANNRSRIRAGIWALGDREAQERVFSAPTVDAEVPRVLGNSSGFWVAWLELRTQVEPGRSDLPGEVRVVQRSVRILPLNERGEPASTPIAVTPEDAFVQDYDLWLTAQQTLLVAWRERAHADRLREGIVHLARVNSDGSVEQQAIEGAAGATMAMLVGDPLPARAAPSLWLTTETYDGTTALAALGSDGKLLETLAPVSELGVGSVVAALSGRLLVAEPRGRDLSLQSYRCNPAPGRRKAPSGEPQRLPLTDAGGSPPGSGP